MSNFISQPANAVFAGNPIDYQAEDNFNPSSLRAALFMESLHSEGDFARVYSEEKPYYEGRKPIFRLNEVIASELEYELPADTPSHKARTMAKRFFAVPVGWKDIVDAVSGHTAQTGGAYEPLAVSLEAGKAYQVQAYDIERYNEGDNGLRLGTDTLKLFSGNCLLYTSPSPRDRTRSRMPSSA